MSSLDKKYEYVIQAIEHLKHRKARPDLEGIKNYAFRRHGIDPVTCCADVDELIDSEHIIKVEFKGRTSYRNAAKYLGPDAANTSSTVESSPQQQTRDASPEPVSYSSAVTAAIAAILCDQPTPPSQTGAVSIRSIASYLQSRDHGRYSRKYIDNLIEREIAACNIASISKETFTLPPSVLKNLDRRWKHEHMKSKRKASGAAEDLNKSKNQLNKSKNVPSKVEKSPPPTPPRPERVGQRMKRAKKVFDPSDVEVIPRKRGRPVGTGKKNRELRNSFATTPERSKSPFLLTGSSPPNSYSHSEFKACLLCKYYTVILRGVTSKMLVCSECNRNVHAKCLGFDQDVLPRVPESEWKCPDCRPCSVCKLVQEQDTVLLCCECDTTFHRSCLTSPPATMPDGCYWTCDDCRANESVEKTPVKDSSSEEGKVENKISPSPFQPSAPISLGPWVFGTRQLELKGPPFEWDCVPNPDPTIPDASQWTSEDVQSYFSRLGFEEQATLLRHNEIDGPSLLLMKRNDIVVNMGLKLGPAVKIYNHIRRLQTRRDDLLYA
ncbi:protein let-418-like [Daphnia carinata]|uniref:protein let-418-like n=1 Tax=Daphnia carinata TaxID=120202 RepID=UPI00257A5230|nr:protein let-418-like [Daphnia carinata]